MYFIIKLLFLCIYFFAGNGNKTQTDESSCAPVAHTNSSLLISLIVVTALLAVIFAAYIAIHFAEKDLNRTHNMQLL